MDKYELVLDLIEHPGNYTSEQLDEILSDPEAREIYNLICETDSAVEANRVVDVDAEWTRFSQAHIIGRRPRFFSLSGSRAASTAAIICTSIAAFAAGIAVTVAVAERKTVADTGGCTEEKAAVTAIATDSIPVLADAPSVGLEPIVFEDVTLQSIMEAVAATYGVEIIFNNSEAAGLHLYYKFDPALSLDEIVSQLNTFGRINIRCDSNTLTID